MRIQIRNIFALVPSLSVKVVAKEGFLQDKPGDSLTFETAILPFSVVAEEHRTGFEETGI